MDPLLFNALRDGAPITHLVTAELPGYTIRWLLGGGFVPWAGQIYQARDAAYGVLNSISEIADGVGDDSSPVQLEIRPPDLASLAALAAADAQGGKVQIHLGAVDRETGLLIGDPYRLHVGFLDRPEYSVGTRTLIYDILTAEALALEPNEEQRQSDAFHQDIWPGERGYEYQTDGPKKVFWREDDPDNAIGFISPKKRKGGDPLEFTYDTDAGWPFPFGRTNVKGGINARFGFGPTNRFQSVFVTVAASGPIQSFETWNIGDEITTLGTEGVATSGSHVGEMWVQAKLGTQPQTALTVPASIGYAPTEWTAAHDMSGKACFVATMKENSKKSEFQGGVPVFEETVLGLKGWDPSIPESEIDDPTTWLYLETGPFAALNWAIGRWEGPTGDGRYGVPYETKLVGGYGAPLDAIDVQAHFDAHAVAIAHGWKVSDVPTSADDKHDVRKRLLQSAGCEPATICGLISVVCNAAPVTSLFDVTNRDTAGDIAIALQASRLERRNVALPKFKSEANRWELTQIGAVGDSDWIILDGGRRATGPSYPTVPDKDQCAALAYLDLAHDRALIGECPFLPHMMAVEPGEAFTWQEPEFLLVGVKVQVRSRSYDPMTALAKLTFRAERDADYTEALGVVAGAPPAADTTTAPPRYTTARIPLYRTTLDGSAVIVSATQPTPGATETSIDIIAHKAWFAEGPPVEFAADTIPALTGESAYGVFGQEGSVYEVEASPATTHMSDPRWVVIGFQITSDAGGTFPDPAPRPPGSSGDTPLEVEP